MSVYLWAHISVVGGAIAFVLDDRNSATVYDFVSEAIPVALKMLTCGGCMYYVYLCIHFSAHAVTN